MGTSRRMSYGNKLKVYQSAAFKVKDPAALQKIKVGDQVDATFTEAVAIEVTAAPAK